MNLFRSTKLLNCILLLCALLIGSLLALNHVPNLCENPLHSSQSSNNEQSPSNSLHRSRTVDRTENFEVVVSKNLFSPDRRFSGYEYDNTDQEIDFVDIPAGLFLSGTIIMESKRIALLRHPDIMDGRALPYECGESIDAFVVYDVQREAVLLSDNQGGSARLELERDPGISARSPRATQSKNNRRKTAKRNGKNDQIPD